jgi:hypothetical protein
MATPTAHVKLVRADLQLVDNQFLKVYRLRIDAAEIKGFADNRIFVYARKPVDPYTQFVPDEFQCVASVVDMTEYPGDEPDPLGAVPFFRLSYVELDVRAALLVEEIWTAIQAEVCILCQAIDAAQTLTQTQEVWVCAPPDETDSISESISL